MNEWMDDRLNGSGGGDDGATLREGFIPRVLFFSPCLALPCFSLRFFAVVVVAAVVDDVLTRECPSAPLRSGCGRVARVWARGAGAERKPCV